MSEASFRIERVSPVIGAEVSGLDLRQPLSPPTVKRLQEALAEHLALFFRDQDITQEQHSAFGRCFGELHIHPAAPKDPRYPEVLVVRGDDKVKFVAGSEWHTDVSCDIEPPMGSILRLVETPSCGGDTLFANMYAAFEGLSKPMQRMLTELTAVHEGEHYYRERYGKATLRDSDHPVAEHPVVRTHPVTGRQALFVNAGFTTRIKDVSPAESEALLSFLCRHAGEPQYHYRFQWRRNSIAFWDNRCTQHRAIWDYWPETRLGYRVTIKGDRPYYDANAQARRLAGVSG